MLPAPAYIAPPVAVTGPPTLASPRSASAPSRMLNATRQLIGMCTGAVTGSWYLENACARVIARRGTRADADALLAAFLDAPSERERLIAPLTYIGDADAARTLLERCCDEQGLRPGVPDGVLHCLGYHGVEEAEALLWGYASGDPVFRTENEWSAATAAVHGLLHLPCDGIRDRIGPAVRECVGQNLFPEYLPALAYKTGDPALLDTLWQIAETASTDCNGGLILGVALYAEAGRERFAELTWSPGWSAADTGTGSVNALHAGMCVLGIPLREVYDEWVRRLAAGDDDTHGLFMLMNLAGTRLGSWHTGLRFAPGPPDTVTDVHERLTRWSTPWEDDSFSALARRQLARVEHPAADAIVQEIEGLEQQLRIRMEEELLLAEG